MTVTVYSSSDVGAPTFNQVAGSLITLLDACLVNGYGSKAAAGWTKEYSATNQAVYKMASGGTDSVLVVKDAATTNCVTTAGLTSILMGAESASGANAWKNTFPYGGGASVIPIIRKPDTGTGDAAWMLIANGRFFYLFTRRSGWRTTNGEDYRYWSMFFFGDIEKLLESDESNCIIGGTNNQVADTDNNSNVNATCEFPNGGASYTGRYAGYMGGTVDNFESGGIRSMYTHTFEVGHSVSNYDLSYTDIHSRGPILIPIYIQHLVDPTGYWIASPRGKLPGLYRNLIPVGMQISGTTPPYVQTMPSIIDNTDITFSSGDLNGKTIKLFNMIGDSRGTGAHVVSNWGIETSDGWAN